ncbi:MAG: HNH endonuclease [Candidatus Hydrothermota bacterium]|nr:MAG: HNH endonuclease [Candidatus Hydrothermae bacterium]
MRRVSGKVLVLNNNYEPLNISTVRRALRLILLGKAEVIYSYDGELLRAEKVAFPKPSVIRLLRYVKIRREVPLTKKNILKRDNYTCQYCGRRDLPLTIDHVIPKRLGGKDTWENLVCACVYCNNRKGDRTPEQAGMKLLRKPRKPSYFVFITQGIRIPDERWKPFLFLD